MVLILLLNKFLDIIDLYKCICLTILFVLHLNDVQNMITENLLILKILK